MGVTIAGQYHFGHLITNSPFRKINMLYAATRILLTLAGYHAHVRACPSLTCLSCPDTYPAK